jgi:hypothetical protein
LIAAWTRGIDWKLPHRIWWQLSGEKKVSTGIDRAPSIGFIGFLNAVKDAVPADNVIHAILRGAMVTLRVLTR